VARILVASDVPMTAHQIEGAVHEPDTTIEAVTSGREVLDAVRADPWDLVILDLQIGSMGGMAICMDLRLDESAGLLPYVPVLMLLDRRADVFLARRCGAEGWLAKPLDPLRIRRAVRSLVSGGTFHDSSYTPTAVPVIRERGGTAVGGTTEDIAQTTLSR